MILSRRCTFLMLSLLICVLWKPPVGAQPALVKDINLLPPSSAPHDLVAIGNVGYFVATNGVTGAELWRSNGTAVGTVLVKDIRPGTLSSFALNLESLTTVNGVLYFVANNGVTGYELWRSNGTAAGTVLVKDIGLGSVNSFPLSLTTVNGVLYFTAYVGITGRELWRSNGTAAGTVLVKDIWPGTVGSFPPNFDAALTNVNGVLYFVADNGVHGRELWRLAP